MIMNILAFLKNKIGTDALQINESK